MSKKKDRKYGRCMCGHYLTGKAFEEQKCDNCGRVMPKI